MYRKYNSKKIIVDGITFDSKKEATRYKELRVLEKTGIISDLQRQVKFTLIPAQYKPVETTLSMSNKNNRVQKKKLIERECAYYADFVYSRDNKAIVEDVKGYRKGQAYSLFTIKRKLMLYIYGIHVIEI